MQERRALTTLTDEAPSMTDRPHLPRVGTRALVAGTVAAAVVATDQVTKSWAVHRLAHAPIHLVGTLDLQLEYNTGSAFSLFTGETVLVTMIGVALVAVLGVMVVRARSVGRAAIFGLIVGGALGNLSDRIFRGDHGAVVDFIALHFWPTFNVADSCIVAGCLLLAVSLIRSPAGDG